MAGNEVPSFALEMISGMPRHLRRAVRLPAILPNPDCSPPQPFPALSLPPPPRPRCALPAVLHNPTKIGVKTLLFGTHPATLYWLQLPAGLQEGEVHAVDQAFPAILFHAPLHPDAPVILVKVLGDFLEPGRHRLFLLFGCWAGWLVGWLAGGWVAAGWLAAAWLVAGWLTAGWLADGLLAGGVAWWLTGCLLALHAA